jgi:hypothetical protein
MPDACTLPTVERPVRAAEFDALLDASVHGVERLDKYRLRLILDRSPDVGAAAARFAVNETGCCAFFTFTLTADGEGLRLEVAVPEGQTNVLDALTARVDR